MKRQITPISTDSERRINAWLEGEAAAAAGQPQTANPWSVRSPYHPQWDGGWKSWHHHQAKRVEPQTRMIARLAEPKPAAQWPMWIALGVLALIAAAAAILSGR